MQIARTLPDLIHHCTRLREGRATLALVPTMGALHAGHRALVDAAVGTGAATVTSIFVNPLQFAPTEDLRRYPRDEAGDLATLEACGCDLVWMPAVAAMYPPGGATTIDPAGPAERWEGTHRPGHFRGMATVVAKLFGQVRPDAAFFGEKDWQQLQVIRQVVRDLDMPIRIIGCPTVREADGLAMSSRNRFLDPAARSQARALPGAMQAAITAMARGTPAATALAAARAGLTAAGFALDYLALVEPETLREVAAPPGRLIAAARLGGVRLLDNMPA